MSAKAAVLIRTGAAERAFEIRDIPPPSAVPGGVRIQVEAFGLNFADVMARLGMYQDAPPLPAVLGYEVVGRVIQPGTSGLAMGARVIAFTRFGGYASEVVAPAAMVVAIGERLAADEAAALATQGCTAWYLAEEMVRLHDGDRVLIHAAAGGVGTLLAQLALRRGCLVAGVVSSEAKAAHLRKLGVERALVVPRGGDFSAAVKKAFDGRALDVAFDSVGGATTKRNLALLGAGGRWVGYGAAEMAGPGGLLRSARMAARFGIFSPISLLMASRGMIGVNLLRIADGRPEAVARCLRAVTELAAQGGLRPVGGGVRPVAELAAAHAELGEGRSIGKLAVRW